jgi:RHS repeat-associated protein
MIYSQVTNLVEQSRVTSRYAYDALGRRTIEQDEGSSPVRTLYDGRSFEAVRSGVMFSDGRFTTRYSEGIQRTSNSGTEGSRYRWVSAGENETRTRSTGEYSPVTARYTGISVTLYGRGEAVAVSRSASEGTRGGPAYLGKDILGSVKTATNEYGVLEERYEYDAFGKPYKGDIGSGMNLGYTGKPYDRTTGLYNYGYRDYKPEAARFTTADPVRDGSNWFAYVNNDPVNWVDLWGLDTTVIITHSDRWWEKPFGGSHTAIYMSNPDKEKTTLYDPSGSYLPEGTSTRPSEGIYWNVPEKTLDDFIKYETRNGQTVNTSTLNTTPQQEDKLIQLAADTGNGSGFQCAMNTSFVLSQTIEEINYVMTPGGLEKQLEKMFVGGNAEKATYGGTNCSGD